MPNLTSAAQPRKPKSNARFVFEIYLNAEKGGSFQWRWRLWARNGRIVANGGESFKRKADAVKICHRLATGRQDFFEVVVPEQS